MTIVEELLSFGEGDNLAGVYCAPPTAERTGTGLVLLNAGLLHKVGPFRMWVDLARRLASRGEMLRS